MTTSIRTAVVFLLGIGLGLLPFLPNFFRNQNLISLLIYFLIFLVGVEVGGDSAAFNAFRSLKKRFLVIPVLTILGTWIGSFISFMLFHTYTLAQWLAVGSGFGYYSLSSVLITNLKGESLGIIALLTNLFREIITLIFCPLFIRFFGTHPAISAGGATTMDTTFASIVKNSSKKAMAPAMISGVILSLLAPLIITGLLSR